MTCARETSRNLAGSRDSIRRCWRTTRPGTRRVYRSIDVSTYLGADDLEGCSDIAATSTGTVYVTGGTLSSTFPTFNAIDPTFGGVCDGYVAKLSADGASLIYSAYLGGIGYDQMQTIALDDWGVVCPAGVTGSQQMHVTSGYDSTYNGGDTDGFIVKLQ